MNLIEYRSEFDRCWPWLWASLCEFGPTHTKDQVWRRIVTGEAYLWPGRNCAIVTDFSDFPIGYRALNYWLQGAAPGHLAELQALHPQIEDFAKQAGCAQVTGRGRDGWSRVMNGDWRKGPSTRMKWLGEPPAVVRRALRS